MNDPEVTMLDPLPNSNLIAYRKALEAAGIAMALVARVPAPLKSLADQDNRSAASVPANLAEGHVKTEETELTTGELPRPSRKRWTAT